MARFETQTTRSRMSIPCESKYSNMNKTGIITSTTPVNNSNG